LNGPAAGGESAGRGRGLLRPEAIDKFRKIGNGPNVAPSVIDGLRAADEKGELEPALMRIIGEVDETPHGPTEIADITSVHLDVLGRPAFAGVVIKGRSWRKVRALDVADQLQRAAALPDIGLLILAAVGDIQDDAKQRLAWLAGRVNADWLVLDRGDLARLFAAYGELCPHDGSWLAGTPCRACGFRLPSKGRTLRPPYTILSLQDTSFAISKRYSVHLLVPPGLEEHEIEARLRAAIPVLRKEHYSRNQKVEAAHGERLADVLWVFVYEDVADRPFANWICRGLWMSRNLDPRFAPASFGNPDALDPELRIEWSTIHEAVTSLLSDRLDKGTYLRDLDRYLSGVHGLMAQATTILDEPSLTIDGEQALEGIGRHIEQLPRPDESKVAPYELADLDDAFAAVDVDALNLGLFFSARGREVWPEIARRQWFGRKAVADYRVARAKLDFERAKVR
jgi:hypothetical protein